MDYSVMWTYYRRRLEQSLQPHDLDTPEVEPVELPTAPAITGGADDDARDRERQAGLKAWFSAPIDSNSSELTLDMVRRAFGPIPGERLSCRFPFAACDLSEGVVPRQVF